MWTDKNRARYNRDHLRYPSDLTDAEWGHIEPLIPPARRGGRRREVGERNLANGLMYVLSGMPVARYSQGFAAQKHAVPLLLRLEP